MTDIATMETGFKSVDILKAKLHFIALFAFYLWLGIFVYHSSKNLDLPYQFSSLLVVYFFIMTYSFFSARKKKAQIMEEHGLKCLNCNKTPQAIIAVQTSKSGFCPHCQLKYVP